MQMQISAETNNHERTVNHHATDILHQQESTLTSLNFQIGDRRARAQLLLVVGLKKTVFGRVEQKIDYASCLLKTF